LTALFRFTDAFYAMPSLYAWYCLCAYVQNKNQNCEKKKNFQTSKKSGPESGHVGHVNNTVIGDNTRGYIFITNFLHRQ